MRAKHKSFVAKIPTIHKLFMAILSGALVAAGGAQALAMLHH